MALLRATFKLVYHTLLVSNILLMSSFFSLLPCNAENVSVSTVCIGETLTLMCNVEGMATSIVWKGMLFDCSSSNDELVLIPRTNSSTNKSCNDGDIRAMISDKNGGIFESRLDLTLTSKYFELSEEELTVQCMFDNGTCTEVVAGYSLFLEDCSTNSNEDQNQNVLEGTENNLTVIAVGVSIAVVAFFMLIMVIMLGVATARIRKRTLSSSRRLTISHTVPLRSSTYVEMNPSQQNNTSTGVYSHLCYEQKVSIDNDEYSSPDPVPRQLMDEGNPTEYSRLGVVNCNHPQQSGIIAITCMHDYRHTQGVQCQLFCVLRSDPSLDLDSVLMRLQQSVNYKLWYTFGLELGVPVNILENLIRYPENECMVEITDYWLRNHPDKPTWSEIENAIKKFGKNAIKPQVTVREEDQVHSPEAPPPPLPPKP